jgi:hypothetical protein
MSSRTRKSQRKRPKRVNRSTRKRGGANIEACKASLLSSYNKNRYEKAEVDLHAQSIGKLKDLIRSEDKIFVFGDRNHGDAFIDFIKYAHKHSCFSEDELAILRNSYFFAETKHVESLADLHFDPSKLIAVDVLLGLNGGKMEDRMETLNDKWTTFIKSVHDSELEFPYKYFIMLGRSHLYANQKSKQEIVSAFPYYFKNHTKLNIRPFVLYDSDEVNKYLNENGVVPVHEHFLPLNDFPFIENEY